MIIVDVNIVFSAAVKPSGVIGSILFSEKNELLVAPTHLQEEIEEHKPRLIAIAKKTEAEIEFILETLFEKITFYPAGIVSDSILEKAKELVADIDPDDFIYVAFAFFSAPKSGQVIRCWRKD